eukprot:1026201-Pyramimonas_sp.AAC.1
MVKEALEKELKAARDQLNSQKPPLSGHTALGHKLQRTQQKLDKQEDDIKAQEALIKAAQEELVAMQAKARQLRVEVEATKVELQTTMSKVVPPVAPSFELKAETVQSDPEVQQLVSSAAFG